jgi:glutamyl-tRNA synthetase
MAVVTRFPPSPTGYLHIGSARTALFSWLYARKHGGRFVLRIEDTDRERSSEESVQAILDGMNWLGLDYDEGPFFQTQRTNRYQEVIDQLLTAGKAYHCYCTREELDEMREQQRARGDKPRYDGRCRHRNQPQEDIHPVVRFKNPPDGNVVIDDLVKGRIIISNSELDDLIIARSDGTPTYNFTVVVDDMDMQITHVIRGDDHVNNTPRQINILKALGVEPPRYAHVPMILGEDGKRLSKRHGAVSVMQYRDDGYLPQALVNYLVRLGWSHGDQEIFTRQEIIDLFDISNVQRGSAVFNPDKLLWLNYEYIKAATVQELQDHARWHFENAGINIDEQPDWEQVFRVNQQRSKTLLELVERSRFFFQDIDGYDAKAVKKHFKGQACEVLVELRAQLERLDPWNAEYIHLCLHRLAERRSIGLGKIAQPLRIAVAGTAVSPPIDETLAILGKEKVLRRIDAAVDYFNTMM